VIADESQRTSRDGIFAGGDLSRGGATVILAMRDGKIAAENIHKYLQQKVH
jgi:glutamate synthase (NADPH/NADH) small chain